jgi:hypothetical protein
LTIHKTIHKRFGVHVLIVTVRISPIHGDTIHELFHRDMEAVDQSTVANRADFPVSWEDTYSLVHTITMISFDFEKMLEMCSNDFELLKDILDIFCFQGRQRIETLENHIEQYILTNVIVDAVRFATTLLNHTCTSKTHFLTTDVSSGSRKKSKSAESDQCSRRASRRNTQYGQRRVPGGRDHYS